MSSHDIDNEDIKQNIQSEDVKINKNTYNLKNRILSINNKSDQFIDENDIKNNISKSEENNNSKIFNQSISNNPIMDQLVDFGYNKIFSKRLVQYLIPQDIEEALDYFSKSKDIIQHRFIQDRNTKKTICYICGENKENHLDYIPENNNNINNNINLVIYNNKNKRNIEEIDDDLDLTNQNKCEICDKLFVSKKQNTVNNCGHSYCNSCWYDFLSVQIKENKLSHIKCLNYECKEKLSDEFIIYLLNNDDVLIKKYKRFKLELEILNNPNKKLCPFPNCDSYLELKNEKNKNVTCLNNHTFCFLCLEKPHGKLSCNAKFDKDIIEFTKNNFVKKCPNCSIITQKSSGCNHIICSKCGYQWCWLCNGKYTEGHYNSGKCRGFQFFKPKDEYEIKLAFEGKIVLNESEGNLI